MPITLPNLLNQRNQFVPPKAVIGGGYDDSEAKQFLEFCIELNNQDDRAKDHKESRIGTKNNADPGDWQLVYDSRNSGNHEWNYYYDYAGQLDDLENPNNSAHNGFGPTNSAWLLARKPGTDEYAIAIRGTVLEFRSILDDAYATSTQAWGGILDPDGRRLPLAFASTLNAEVHLGFAYAAYGLLFEKERGILAHLKGRHVSRLYITGHSQGAAVATLLHAFFYYALTDADDTYRLKDLITLETETGLQLKSYVFAQPKPGNLQFSQDFARISRNMFFVINNDRDPVPQVPLSMESVSEVSGYVEDDNEESSYSVGSFVDHFLGDITYAKDSLKNIIAQKFNSDVATQFNNENLDLSYFKQTLKQEPWKAKSLNYTLAGELIPIFGMLKGGDVYPEKDPDILLQHHATNYRILLDGKY